MLKKFFLIVCGSFVGAFLAIVFVIIASLIMSFGLMSKMGAQSRSVDSNSILYLRLDGSVDERQTVDNPFMTAMPFGQNGPTISLATFKKSLEIAADEKDIVMVYLDCRGISASPASLQQMRKALSDFKKKSKKKIYAYGDESISQADYYLASVSDSIFLNPIGSVSMHGFGGSQPYFKGLLDKVGVEMQVVRVGSYKSAVEPFILEHMSPENREQTEHYLGSIWGCMRDSSAASRKFKAEELDQLADSMADFLLPKELISKRLVDKLCYRTQFEDILRKITKVEKDEDLKLVEPSDLVTDEDVIIDNGGDEIAVLYATGEIDSGTSSPMSTGTDINSEELAKQIRELQNNEDVKGLVLRVNSPGGSAFGSEVIWKALEDFKASGKPFAVSMGDYAASGGYYISCGAGRIFAEPTTITGSIGVFGLIPNLQGTAQDKLGVNFEAVKTHENSDFGGIFRPLSEYERTKLQTMVNNTYDLFTKRCADGRNIKQDSIKAIGQGRVWDGITAKKIGLVDEFGGIDAAVAWVANKAGLKKGKYSAKAYPNVDTSFMAMFEQMQNAKVRSEMQQQMGVFYTTYVELQAVLGRRHVLCLMDPIELTF